MKKLTIAEMNRLSVEEYIKADKLPFAMILDNVRSRHNVGAVFRTADAMCIERLFLCGITACPPDEDIHKTALGAEQAVPWNYLRDTREAVLQLRAAGYTCLAVEQAHDSISLEECAARLKHKMAQDTPPKIVAIVGHEVFGVQQEVIDLCDACIEIPQFGTKHSMNVSVTAGIILYTLSNALRTHYPS